MIRSSIRDTTCCQWNWGPFSVNLCFVLFCLLAFMCATQKCHASYPFVHTSLIGSIHCKESLVWCEEPRPRNCDRGKAVLSSHLTDQQHICPSPELALWLGLPQYPPHLFPARLREGADPQTQSSMISTTQGGIRISRKSPSQGPALNKFNPFNERI